MFTKTHTKTSSGFAAWRRRLYLLAVSSLLFCTNCFYIWDPFLIYRCADGGGCGSDAQGVRFSTPVTISLGPTGKAPLSVKVGYFNDDGNLDLVVASLYTGDVSVLLGDG